MRHRSSSLVGSPGISFPFLARLWGMKGRQGGWGRFWLRFCTWEPTLSSARLSIHALKGKRSQQSFQGLHLAIGLPDHAQIF